MALLTEHAGNTTNRIVVREVRRAKAFRADPRDQAGCGFLCTVHAKSAADALKALVNAASMTAERIVRKVFSEALALVVHVGRNVIAPARPAFAGRYRDHRGECVADQRQRETTSRYVD